MSTYFIDEQTEKIAFELAESLRCRRTALDLLSGAHDWSLASLKGKAKHYGGSYARSRDTFLRELHKAGLDPVTLYVRPHNKRIVII